MRRGLPFTVDIDALAVADLARPRLDAALELRREGDGRRVRYPARTGTTILACRRGLDLAVAEHLDGDGSAARRRVRRVRRRLERLAPKLPEQPRQRVDQALSLLREAP